MDETKILKELSNYIFHLFRDDPTGHDFFHMKRVAATARKIAEHEGADPFIAEAAGWIHDAGDDKLFKDPQQASEKAFIFLHSLGIPSKTIEDIEKAYKDTSYRKGLIPSSLEGKIVQDADRIDAIGAVGIARTFAYGGANGQLIYHEGEKANSVQHFYDKLLHLKDTLHTETAKKIAFERHEFLEKFLEQFHLEWQGGE
ncbi:HD domain-containing protein [Virgibacillus sediminis]|uniref:HD domain-containing protein n=1 Tax=Virgibacillus sediminis TaxID=202260 RepID=A0ABV7A5I7_9BACI